jgi:hypothetical protein
MITNNTKIESPKKWPRLFSTDSAKAAKSSGYGYINAIQYIAPHKLGGAGNLCSHASPQCIAICLGEFSGQAAMVKDLDHDLNATRKSRRLKAQLFMHHRGEYMNRLARDIVKLSNKANQEGFKLCVRLNGSTDIAWERISFQIDDKTSKALGNQWQGRIFTLLQLFPHIQFVEYTKNPNRLGKAPPNLDLTLSYSANNSIDCVEALQAGHNVAMVFHDGLPDSFAGFPVINGDNHDLRHLDAKGGYIVGLSPKGKKAQEDQSGFVVRWKEPSGQALQSAWQIMTKLAA